MERKIQTRQTTGASGERRVWDFSVKKQKDWEDVTEAKQKSKSKLITKKQCHITNKNVKDKCVKVNEPIGVQSVEINNVNGSKDDHLNPKDNKQEINVKQKASKHDALENAVDSRVKGRIIHQKIGLEKSNNPSGKDEIKQTHQSIMKSPRISITKERDTNISKQDNVSLIILDGSEQDLIGEMEEFVLDSEISNTLYSVHAKHVNILKADVTELENGEQVVKLPKIKDIKGLIFIALLMREDETSEVQSEFTTSSMDTSALPKKSPEKTVDTKCYERISDKTVEDTNETTFKPAVVAVNENKVESKTEHSHKPFIELNTMSCDTSTVECKKVLSAYEIHRHLEPSCTQPSTYECVGKENHNNETLSVDSNTKDITYTAVKIDISDFKSKVEENQGESNKCIKEQTSNTFLQDNSDREGNMTNSSIQNIPEVDCPSELLHSSSVGTQIDLDEDDVAMLCESSLKEELFENVEHVKGNILKQQVQNGRDRKYPCKTCGKIFKSRHFLLVHNRIHTGERPYVCQICNKAFNQPCVLRRHKRVHTGERPYVCELCDKAFADLTTLKLHVRSHTGERPYPCQYCDRKFISAAVCKDHVMAIHKGEAKFICDLCGKKFTKSEYFKSHLRTHTGEKPFPCEVCGKKFTCTRNRRRHMSVHTGKRKLFVCDFCGKSISSSTNFTKHRRLHFTEKPHVCDICDKRFRDKKSFENHVKAHKERVQKKCLYCNKEFVMLAHLKRHVLLTHTDVQIEQQVIKPKKPYECEICGKQYKDKLRFVKHQSFHPKGLNVVYKCETCEKIFPTLLSLEKHLATHKQTNFGDDAEYVFITSDGQENIFVCSVCHQGFDSFENFESHAQSHIDTAEVRYLTKIDGEYINDKKELIEEHVTQNAHEIDTGEEELAKTIMQLRNVEFIKHNSPQKAIEQMQESELSNQIENLEHVPLNHNGLMNQAAPIDNIDCVEQVVIEDGHVTEPVQTIVFLTLDSNDGTTAE